MICSICGRSNTRYIYHEWHCLVCENYIRQAVEELNWEDKGEIPTVDLDFDFSANTTIIEKGKTDE